MTNSAAIARQADDDVLDHAVGEDSPARDRRSGSGTAAPRSTASSVVETSAPRRSAARRRPPRRDRARPGRRAPDGRCSSAAGRPHRRSRRRGARRHLPARGAETQMPPGSARFLQARRHVHAVAEDVVTVDHDVADMDADAELDALVRVRSPILRSAMPRCTSTAQRTASTTLSNSTSRPSPVVLTRRPRCSAIFGSTSVAAMRA